MEVTERMSDYFFAEVRAVEWRDIDEMVIFFYLGMRHADEDDTDNQSENSFLLYISNSLKCQLWCFSVMVIKVKVGGALSADLG